MENMTSPHRKKKSLLYSKKRTDLLLVLPFKRETKLLVSLDEPKNRINKMNLKKKKNTSIN